MTSASSNRRRLAVLVGALVLALGACGDDSPQVSSGSTSTSAGPEPTYNLREPKPAGQDWTTAASGADAGVRWTIYTTPATDDGTCYAIDLQPPPDPSFYDPLDDPEAVYKGRVGSCPLRPGSTRENYPRLRSRGETKMPPIPTLSSTAGSVMT